MINYCIQKKVLLTVNNELILQNKDFTNAYKIHYAPTNDSLTNLLFFQTYTMSFGHVLVACLLNYTMYLQNKEVFADYQFSTIDKTRHNHINDLMKLIAYIEKKQLYTITSGDHCFLNVAHENVRNRSIESCRKGVNSLTYTRENPSLKYLPSCCFKRATKKIKGSYYKKNPNLPKKIAIIKCSELLNSGTNMKFFDENKIKYICKQTGYTYLNHCTMKLKDILNYIYNCESLLVSWGATSYFNVFLEQHQTCVCFLSENYHKQFNKHGPRICLTSDLYNYKIIKKPFRIQLNDNDITELIEIINEMNNINSTIQNSLVLSCNYMSKEQHICNENSILKEKIAALEKELKRLKRITTSSNNTLNLLNKYWR
jgi:hypothetical protein